MGKSVSYGDTLPHTVVGVCGETLSQYHLVQHKSDKVWHGIEIAPPSKIITGGAMLSNYYFYTSAAELQLVANERKCPFLIKTLFIVPNGVHYYKSHRNVQTI